MFLDIEKIKNALCIRVLCTCVYMYAKLDTRKRKNSGRPTTESSLKVESKEEKQENT